MGSNRLEPHMTERHWLRFLRSCPTRPCARAQGSPSVDRFPKKPTKSDDPRGVYLTPLGEPDLDEEDPRWGHEDMEDEYPWKNNWQPATFCIISMGEPGYWWLSIHLILWHSQWSAVFFGGECGAGHAHCRRWRRWWGGLVGPPCLRCLRAVGPWARFPPVRQVRGSLWLNFLRREISVAFYVYLTAVDQPLRLKFGWRLPIENADSTGRSYEIWHDNILLHLLLRVKTKMEGRLRTDPSCPSFAGSLLSLAEASRKLFAFQLQIILPSGNHCNLRIPHLGPWFSH